MRKKRGSRVLTAFTVVALVAICVSGAALFFGSGDPGESETPQAGESDIQGQDSRPQENGGETTENQKPEAGTQETENSEEPETDPVEKRALEILSSMTDEEKVGQLFIARCPTDGAVEKVSQYHLGGYILFAVDFKDETPESAREKIDSYQQASRIPMLIGVDEEGGTVNRVSRYPAFRSEPFKSPQELYQEGGLQEIRSDTMEKCQLLSGLGINVNFAPVCDVSQDPQDFMYDRSFGKSAQETAEYVDLVVETMEGTGVASVLKHFPGYGDNEDTHTGIAYDSRPIETFENSDFLPFQAGIEAGAPIVLVSHNIVEAIDASQPASISPQVHRVLREELGFDGVIVTDDLAMDGIRDFISDDRAAVAAVLAGNDLLCCTDFETQLPTVLDAVRSGEISRERLDESVMRILKLKIELGLMD